MGASIPGRALNAAHAVQFHIWRNRSLLLRVLIGSGCVGLAAGLAWVATKLQNPTLLAGLVICAAIVLIGLLRGSIALGILAAILAAMTISFTLPTGTASRIPISMVVSAGLVVWWVVHKLAGEKSIGFEPSLTNVAFLCFMISVPISYFWSILFRDSILWIWSTWPFVQIAGLALLLLLPMMLCITADQFRKIQWLRWLSVAFLAVGTLSILDTIIGTDQLEFLQVRPLFPTWFLALAFSMVFFHRKIQLWIRILLLFVAGLWCIHLFIHQFQWLSTWIPSMVCILFLAFMRSKPLFFSLVLIVIVIALFNLPTLESYFEIEMAISGTTRWDAWLHNWTITRDHWLFGVGPAGYALYYMTYFPSNAMATHSNYIDVLSQTGVVGFLFFIVLLAGLGVELWRSFLRHRGAGDLSEAFSAAVFGGYLSVLLAMALGDWILPFVYTQTIAGFNYALYSWVMLGAGLGLSRHAEGL